MTPINHSQLRAFHAVASEGSFTKAANMLHVTQPTLSGQVKALEDQFGVRLFDRRKRRIELTDIGRNLFDITFRLFSLEREAEQVLTSARGLKRGHLRVGADAPYHSVPFLAVFHRRYPSLRLSMSIGNSEKLIEDLLDQRCDVAIAANVTADPRIFSLPFREDYLIAFVDRAHPWATRKQIPLTDLAGKRLVLRETSSTTRRTFETAMAAGGINGDGISPGEILEIGSREAIREAVAAGLGIGIVAHSEFGDDVRLKAIELAGERIKSVEYVACLQDRRTTPLVKAFLDIVREGLAEGKHGR
jgi:aminoethylphosphonate catabolism LysR family transcriptional regulator